MLSLRNGNSFKTQHPFEKRRREAQNILYRYPSRVPIICELAGRDAPELKKKKYLVPKDLMMTQFMYIIRKRVKLPPEKAMYMFINNKLMPGNSLIAEIYENEKDNDGFLYVTYSGENTFGGE